MDLYKNTNGLPFPQPFVSPDGKAQQTCVDDWAINRVIADSLHGTDWNGNEKTSLLIIAARLHGHTVTHEHGLVLARHVQKRDGARHAQSIQAAMRRCLNKLTVRQGSTLGAAAATLGSTTGLAVSLTNLVLTPFMSARRMTLTKPKAFRWVKQGAHRAG